ncbi:MAG: serine/threonine protein kinase [Lachnospiraceae bacterium]|nr:serine/threonine protein kinase [Lachnospiraceae bacterium]
MKYQTIVTIKESEKATVELAAIELFVGPVIVKRLKGGNPEIYRLLSIQSNPHIPQIYAVEEQENELLIAEEYVDGESLSEHLQKNLLSDEQKLNYALQLCEAVGFLHALNPSVIHRDIKPSNILINGKGELKLIDFDASRYYKEAPSSSDTRLLGTVEYAPPEQFGYSQTDVRSDIYSMGVVFHEMRPTENKRLAEQWEKIAEKCTSFDPKNRYQSVAELKRELEKLADWKKSRRGKIAAWIGGAAVLLAVAVLAVVMWHGQGAAKDVDGANMTTVPTSVPTDAPTLLPTNVPTLTLTNIPTETPTPEPTVTPADMPIPTRIATVTSSSGNIGNNFISMGSEIADELLKQSFYIDTFYKGLDTGADFMQYSTLYEGKEVSFTKIRVENLETGEYFLVPEDLFYNENNVVHIKRSYMLEWAESCYRLDIEYEDSANGRRGSMTTHLMIYDGDKVAENAQLFDNNYLEYYYEYDACVHTILANDIVGRFKDTGEYRLLENGRVIEFDADFLKQHVVLGGSGEFFLTLELENGRRQQLAIRYLSGKPSYVY